MNAIIDFRASPIGFESHLLIRQIYDVLWRFKMFVQFVVLVHIFVRFMDLHVCLQVCLHVLLINFHDHHYSINHSED